MSFSLALGSKRLLMIDDQGKSEFEQPASLDASYLALLDPHRAETEAGTDKTGEEADADEALKPWEAYEKFTTAKGELDVVIDLINNLEGARYLDFRILANKPRSVNALQELAAESMARFGRHRAALRDVSQRLAQGAAALRAAAQLDNRFYGQIKQLQRFWKLRLNPLVAEFADSPFSVDISLMEGAGQSQATAGEAEARGAADATSRLGMSALIPLVKHPSGDVCLHLDSHAVEGQASTSAPAATKTSKEGVRYVARGARAVHRHLLSLQQRIMWRTVGQCLDEEAKAAASTSNFTYSMATQVLSAMSAPSSSHQLAALRPLVLEHVGMCRLPHGSIHEPARPYTPALSSAALLPELSSWVSHMFYRDHLFEHLDAQAHQLRSVRLHWLPSCRPCTTATQVCLAPDHRLLLLAQVEPGRFSVEVEGIPTPLGTSSRWAREGTVSVTKLEVPTVIHSLVQQAFGSSARREA